MLGLARWLAGRGSAAGRSRIDAAHSAPARPRLGRRAAEAPRDPAGQSLAPADGSDEAAYAEMIRGVLRRGAGVAVAGHRPGRAAAAMIGWTLAQAGLDPTILVRGPVPQLGGLARAGAGRHAVVDLAESPGFVVDEPPGPAILALLDGVGMGDGGLLTRAVDCVGPSGYVLAGPAMPPASWMVDGRVASVSLERGSTWWGGDLREERGRYRFRVFHRGRFVAEIRLQVPGRSNVLGAVAALAACERAGLAPREIKPALEEFAGVSGGFESRGSYRGVTLVEDEATSPGEIAEALATARAVHGRRRLWAAVAASGRPDSAMADALAGADRVLVLGGDVDAGAWAGMLGGAGLAARPAAGLDEALDELDRHLEPGDVLLTLGSGDVGTIADAFLRRLPRDRQGR
jgi:UDP-N-acetylmuramate--alanine ligase